jgi:hypothetical protein
LPIDPADLVVSIATQGKLEFECGLARTLQQVVDTAKELLGADGVGLMLADTNGQLRRASASNQQAQNIEEHQARAALGLCASAFAKSTPISVRDVHRDPDSYGLRMVLNDAQIVAAPQRPGGTGRLSHRYLGRVLGNTPGLGRQGGQRRPSLRRDRRQPARCGGRRAREGRLAAQLQTALDQRMLIEQAKGILMGKEGIDAATAFECLRAAARSTRRRMVEVANDLIAGRRLPQPRPPRHLDRACRDRVVQQPASMG